jgi:superfamily II DNA or RNA helicase
VVLTVFQYRSYQPPAIAWLASRPRGFVKAPAGSGKTIVAAGAIHRVLKAKQRAHRVKVGWLCNTIEQGQQAYKAMLQVFYGIDAKPAEAETIWKIKSESGDGALLHLRVACAAAMEDWSFADVLIVDECHHAHSESWSTQIQTAKGARWGFTATPPEDEELYSTVVSFFGGEVFEIERAEVKGNLAPAKVVMVDATDANLEVPMDKEITKQCRRRRHFWMGGVIPKKEQDVARLRNSGASNDVIYRAASELYGMEMSLKAQVMWQVVIDMGIVANQTRNRAVISLARTHAQNHVLILVNKIEHGEELIRHIHGAVLCFSKMGVKKRREALAGFASGNIRCLVATSLADEGLDLPMVDVLIMVSGGRSNAKSEQRTGRALRTFHGKTHGQIYDFTDRFHSLAQKHSQARQDLYRRLGYEITYRGALI